MNTPETNYELTQRLCQAAAEPRAQINRMIDMIQAYDDGAEDLSPADAAPTHKYRAQIMRHTSRLIEARDEARAAGADHERADRAGKEARAALRDMLTVGREVRERLSAMIKANAAAASRAEVEADYAPAYHTPAVEAQRLWRTADDAATRAAYAAARAQEYKVNADYAHDKLAEESATEADRAHAVECIEQWTENARGKVTHAIDATEATAAAALQCALIARNHPEDSQAHAAAVYALGALHASAQQTQKALSAHRGTLGSPKPQPEAAAE